MQQRVLYLLQLGRHENKPKLRLQNVGERVADCHDQPIETDGFLVKYSIHRLVPDHGEADRDSVHVEVLIF